MDLIILGGLKHCGKTSLGRTLAQRFECPFFDLDRLILEGAKGDWKSVREIWTILGREEFSLLEEIAVRNFFEWILPTSRHSCSIFSLGGGTIENQEAMNWINRYGLKVYIRAEAELLYRRIMRKGRPPFLSENHPRQDFMDIYERRHVLYEEYSDIIVDVTEVPLEVNMQHLQMEIEHHYVGK